MICNTESCRICMAGEIRAMESKRGRGNATMSCTVLARKLKSETTAEMTAASPPTRSRQWTDKIYRGARCRALEPLLLAMDTRHLTSAKLLGTARSPTLDFT